MGVAQVLIQCWRRGDSGWTCGEAQRHDVEIVDVVIEMVAKASKQILGDGLNPF